MPDPFLFAATVLAQRVPTIAPASNSVQSAPTKQTTTYQAVRNIEIDVHPDPGFSPVEFSAASSPKSGKQLYYQRIAALRSGKLYTRLPTNCYQSFWLRNRQKPSYQQWQRLLAREADAVAKGQGNNRLSIMVGDSLSLWFPGDRLPQNQFWLNQSISGDTTAGILRRLSAFAKTRPTTIYVMAGINDLKRGASDNQILWNLRQIIQRLQKAHPQAQIIVQSILPTRSAKFSNERIVALNQKLEAIAQQDNAVFLNLFAAMSDTEGNLNSELTTDGIHLNARGYRTWQLGLMEAESWMISRGQNQTEGWRV